MLSLDELSYTQSDTYKMYKKLAPLTQERSHCIRNWFTLIFNKWFLNAWSRCVVSQVSAKTKSRLDISGKQGKYIILVEI